MKLMLGFQGKPYLFVEVVGDFSPSNFKFDVINGAWRGSYCSGEITVDKTGDVLYNCSIISDDQVRLNRYTSYNDVIRSFKEDLTEMKYLEKYKINGRSTLIQYELTEKDVNIHKVWVLLMGDNDKRAKVDCLDVLSDYQLEEIARYIEEGGE